MYGVYWVPFFLLSFLIENAKSRKVVDLRFGYATFWFWKAVVVSRFEISKFATIIQNKKLQLEYVYV